MGKIEEFQIEEFKVQYDHCVNEAIELETKDAARALVFAQLASAAAHRLAVEAVLTATTSHRRAAPPAENAIPRVIVESPYAGDIERNLRYLRAAMRDCLRRGEAPYASHGLYTQPGVLRDAVPEERAQGIEAGFAWRDAADKTVVYTDLGFSGGMEAGIAHAVASGIPVEYRQLPPDWND